VLDHLLPRDWREHDAGHQPASETVAEAEPSQPIGGADG
jgi:hypothetical protein